MIVETGVTSWQVIGVAMTAGINTLKRKKKQTVRMAGQPAEKRNKGPLDLDHAQGGEAREEVQKDPLRGKIREPIPDDNLRRAMKW